MILIYGTIASIMFAIIACSAIDVVDFVSKIVKR